MPNWVRNRLSISGDNAAEIMQSYLVKNDIDGEYDFDFNKIIPMPNELDFETGSDVYEAIDIYLTSINPLINYYGDNKIPFEEYLDLCNKIQRSKVKDKPCFAMSQEEIAKKLNKAQRFGKDEKSVLALGKKAVENYKKYGAIDWYDWRCDNWGTKWNAHNTDLLNIENAEVYFDTAWSSVMSLIHKISKAHPECNIEYEFAEEQAGYRAGQYELKNGKIISGADYEPYSKESYEKYFELWGGEDEYTFNEKTGTYESVFEDEME